MGSLKQSHSFLLLLSHIILHTRNIHSIQISEQKTKRYQMAGWWGCTAFPFLGRHTFRICDEPKEPKESNGCDSLIECNELLLNCLPKFPMASKQKISISHENNLTFWCVGEKRFCFVCQNRTVFHFLSFFFFCDLPTESVFSQSCVLLTVPPFLNWSYS